MPHDRPDLLDGFERLLEPGADLSEQIAFLERLNECPPTADELAGYAETLRRRCIRVPDPPRNAIDLCGTGGDRSGTFNISTVASFVVAGAGVPVAKHGNRSVSSRCGSSDCIACLGIETETPPREAGRMLREHGLAFLFAPLYHPAIANVMQARRALSRRGKRTVFNILGPLVNPAGVRRQTVGVFSDSLVETVAEAFRLLGATRAWVVHGSGLDEITLCGETRFARVIDGRIERGSLHPQDLGLTPCRPEELLGGSPDENADIARGILEGKIRGAKRDVVLLNAATGIQVGSDEPRDLEECLGLARESLDSGSAEGKLKQLSGRSSHG